MIATQDTFCSVIVVNFNGREYLLRCLESISRSACQNYEVIVVDNNSPDNTVSYVKEKLRDKIKDIKFLTLSKNYGPARARNEGAKVAKGGVFCFLDNDTQVDKDWMREALQLFESDEKIGCLQCKLLLLNEQDRIDYAGEYINQYGFLIPRAIYKEQDKGQYDAAVEILAAKSAGMFIRRGVFEKIGGFDDDYFIFMEETDLGWRSWLAGYKTLFCPGSVVYHEFSASAAILPENQNNYHVRFHGAKNYIMTLLKNLEGQNLLLMLPAHVLIWFFLSLYFLFGGNVKSAIYTLMGIFWVFAHVKDIFRKRKEIKRFRQVSDRELFKIVLRKQNILNKLNQFLASYRKK